MTRSKYACCVCGCTEDRACEGGCSWAQTEPGSPPLCSTCSGSPADMHEALGRIVSLQRKFGHASDVSRVVGKIARASLGRRKRVVKAQRDAVVAAERQAGARAAKRSARAAQ